MFGNESSISYNSVFQEFDSVVVPRSSSLDNVLSPESSLVIFSFGSGESFISENLFVIGDSISTSLDSSGYSLDKFSSWFSISRFSLKNSDLSLNFL